MSDAVLIFGLLLVFLLVLAFRFPAEVSRMAGRVRSVKLSAGELSVEFFERQLQEAA